MTDITNILKELPLDDSVKSQLTESWTKALDIAKHKQESEIKKSLKESYKSDLESMAGVIETLLESKFKKEVLAFKESYNAFEEEKASFRNNMKAIVAENQKAFEAKSAFLESKLQEVLSKELVELKEDVKATRAKSLHDTQKHKKQYEDMQEAFKVKASAVMENIINLKINSNLEPLVEDIKRASEDQFGRKLFEAFAQEYKRIYFDETKEVKAITESNKALEDKLQKNQDDINKLVESLQESKNEIHSLKSKSLKQDKIDSLTKSLSGKTKHKMSKLLESVDVSDMEDVFHSELNKEQVKNKLSLVESKKSKVSSDDIADSYRRLVGLK